MRYMSACTVLVLMPPTFCVITSLFQPMREIVIIFTACDELIITPTAGDVSEPSFARIMSN